jgi:hypothetical protein
MACSSNALMKMLLCAVLLSTTILHGHCEPDDHRGGVVVITGQRMLVAESDAASSLLATTIPVSVPLFT